MSRHVNPKPFLASQTGQQVIVKLKWGHEYKGTLKSVDAYFNLLLEDTEEWERQEGGDGSWGGKLGSVLVRCNNVLYVRSTEGADEQEAMETA